MNAGGMTVLMVPWMTGDTLSRNPAALRFWFVMSVGLCTGFIVAMPINGWLVNHGLKHGMMTARPAGSTVPQIAAVALAASAASREHRGKSASLAEDRTVIFGRCTAEYRYEGTGRLPANTGITKSGSDRTEASFYWLSCIWSRHSARSIPEPYPAGIVRRLDVAGLVMAGGDTAAACVQKLGAECLHVCGELHDGVAFGPR